MDYPVAIFPQGSLLNKAAEHVGILDLGNGENVGHVTIFIGGQEHGLAYVRAFCEHAATGPVSRSGGGEFPVGVTFPSVTVVEEVFKIPEHNAQRVVPRGREAGQVQGQSQYGQTFLHGPQESHYCPYRGKESYKLLTLSSKNSRNVSQMWNSRTA